MKKKKKKKRIHWRMVKSHLRFPLFNFEADPGVPLLKFEGGPEVPGSWSYFYTMPLVSTSSLVGKKQQSEWQPVTMISSQTALSRTNLLHYFHQKISQEEMVIFEKQFLWSNFCFLAATRENKTLYTTFIFFFLEYHELFKTLQLILFHYKNSKSFKNVSS